MHRTTLGDFELTVVSDGTYFLDGGAFFGVVPKTMWSKKVTPDEQNRLDAGLNSLLVRTGKKNILIETGIGNKLPEKMVQIYKQPAKLLDNLHAAGVAPEDIDIVINTHLHFDHCGWNTVRRGDQVVPRRFRRRSITRSGEWEHGRLQLRTRCHQLHEPELRPADRKRPDGAPGGDQEICPASR
jgi:glyoxylase-like metal-dependent hydrolase (beta-lactamase superfamily II)